MTFRQTTTWLFFLLLALQLGYVAFCYTPMYAALDDVIYQFGARSFAEDGTLYLLNGFEKYKSPLLSYWDFFMEAPNGKLVTQYPPFYSFFGSPFYYIFGEYGLIYFNTLLFFASIYLVYRIAALYFKKDDAYARIAAAIYGFAGFGWLLSILALSHMCALVLILCAFYLAFKPFTEGKEHTKKSLFAIGTLIGIATGCRYDSIFFLPVVCYAFVYFSPNIQYKKIFHVLFGLAPWMLILSYINFIKYGEFLPLSYGSNKLSDINTSNIFYPSLLCLTCFFLYLLHLKKRNKTISKWSVLIFCAFVFASFSIIREIINALIDNGGRWNNLMKHYYYRMDLATRVLFDSQFWIRDNRYRSFLQCIPYAIPALLVLKYDSQQKVWLAIPMLILGVIFVTVGDFGVITPNPRYLLPVLPFVAILTAALLCENKKFLLSKNAYGAAFIFIAFVLGLFLLNSTQGYFYFAGRMIYHISHILLLATIILTMAYLLEKRFTKKPKSAVHKAFLYFVTCTILWSGLSIMMVDYPLLRKNLTVRFNYHQKLASSLPENSAIILGAGPHGGNTILFIYDEHGKNLMVGQATPRVNHIQISQFIDEMFYENRRVFITEETYKKHKMLEVYFPATEFPHEKLYLNFNVLELGQGQLPVTPIKNAAPLPLAE